MPSYQALDRIADACNPALGLVWLSLVAVALAQRRWRAAGARVALGLGCLLVAYGLMWLDGAASLWARMGLDYSTHTAVALALAAAVCAIAPRLLLPVLAWLAAYCLLMLYQRYHAPLDIASTLAAVGIALAGIVLPYRRMLHGHGASLRAVRAA